MENTRTMSVLYKGKQAELKQLPNGKWVCTNIGEFTKLGASITWLDDCRVPTEAGADLNGGGYRGVRDDFNGTSFNMPGTGKEFVAPTGRFPANLLVEGEALGEYSKFFSLDSWADTLPFLQVAKASKREKNEGCEGLPEKIKPLMGEFKENPGRETPKSSPSPRANHHPTVKPLKLMSYLITLGSREGDVVLDPFLGSGTTACAAKSLGRQYIGIEMSNEYIEIAEARLLAIKEQPKQDLLF